MSFDEAAARYRVELMTHCYRLLGSTEDAEDAVQETLLRGFRSLDSWEGRSSMRTWLYAIATNVCMDSHRAAVRRPLPSDLSDPGNPRDLSGEDPAILWLQPIADSALHDERADPAAQVAARSGMRLAFLAALQHLSPVQRAVLVLRDVLAWKAAEVAEALDLTVPSVNNHLQRARRRLSEVAPSHDTAPLDDHAATQRANDYAHTFLRADVDGLVRLLSEDVTLDMPPQPTWFRGRDDVGHFLAHRVAGQRWRALTTRVNTQPAVGLYVEFASEWRPESVHIIDADDHHVRSIIVYRDAETIASLDIPASLTADRHPAELVV